MELSLSGFTALTYINLLGLPPNFCIIPQPPPFLLTLPILLLPQPKLLLLLLMLLKLPLSLLLLLQLLLSLELSLLGAVLRVVAEHLARLAVLPHL